MRRYDSGGRVLKIRSRMMILSCALLATSLSSPSSVHGLSLDAVLDRTLSVAKLNETKDLRPSDDRRQAGKTESASHSVIAPVTTTGSSSSTLATPAPVIVEVLPEVSPIETFDAQQKFTRIPSPTTSAVASTMSTPTTRSWSLLQASNHGWKLLGVAWYWWVVVIGVGGYASRRVVHLRRRQSLDGTVAI